MSIGFSAVGLIADNEREFANVKLDKHTSKLGIPVRFGSAYSPWSNGISEQNHASADLTFHIMMEDMMMPHRFFVKSSTMDSQYFIL